MIISVRGVAPMWLYCPATLKIWLTEWSVYDKYLVYCESWDAVGHLIPGAGVKYFDLSQSLVPEWILWRKAVEAWSRRASSTDHQ